MKLHLTLIHRLIFSWFKARILALGDLTVVQALVHFPDAPAFKHSFDPAGILQELLMVLLQIL